MTCREAFCAIARGCLQDLAANEEAAHAGDAEAVHQTRIALTRLRAARAFFSPVVHAAEWSRLRRELKWLNRHLSKARDLDVAIERLAPDSEQAPQDGAPDRTWQKAWNASRGQLKRALRSHRYRTLVHDMSAWIERTGETPADPTPPRKNHPSSLLAYSFRRLDRWHGKLLKQGRRLESMSTSQRHRFRKRGKRLRYAIEFFGSLLPPNSLPDAEALLTSLRRIQKSLGQLNDVEQGLAIAVALAGSARDDATELPAPLLPSRKAGKRLIKATMRTLRDMEKTAPFAT